MKITLTFDNMEEFLRYVDIRGGVHTTFTDFSPTEIKTLMDMRKAAQKPAEAPEVPFAEEKPEKPVDTGTGAIRGATPEEMEQYKAEEKAAKPAPKAPRVEDVRKTLAALNKKAGKNIAKELIASVGYKKLTEVPEGALVTLQSLIEEEEKNYA